MRICLLALVVGCGGAATTSARHGDRRALPTETDACERICDRMVACKISPPACASSCARDQARLREGVQPAFATCLERELNTCETARISDRRQAVSLCWTATLEALGNDNAAVGVVVRAICMRSARCGEAGENCEKELAAKLSGSAQSKSLAVVRKELIASIASCIDAAGCSDAAAVGTCTEKEP